jgi:NodT family efflux transporter outer membrane factor (OMF) lipoprotein
LTLGGQCGWRNISVNEYAKNADINYSADCNAGRQRGPTVVNRIARTRFGLLNGSLEGDRMDARSPARRSRPRYQLLYGCLSSFLLTLCGCTSLQDYVRNGFKVGPNYGTPPVPLAKEWIDAADKRVRQDADELTRWWKVFKDPVLDKLICSAYEQNLTLRQAGYRILQARAQLGIAVGDFFPQTQLAKGDFLREALSKETVNSNISGFSKQRFFSQWDFGFALAWELDFWGRFRRAIEAADSNLDASVADYDDVLVTLLSDVATNYAQMRITEQRIKYATENVDLQRKTVKIIENREKVGVAKQLDVDQAKSVLYQTEAAIPELEISLRQFTNKLCILLGFPPEELRAKLGAAPIPTAPPEVAVGIPADLLRRRPDVRRAERQAAAQSALIGVAESDFYPHISIDGSFGFSAQHFEDLFRGKAFNGTFGPTFQWNILNYGRIINNVRLQDAKFDELMTAYQNSVLNAQQEVENGLVTFLKAQQRTKLQAESVKYADDAVKMVLAQYELGTVQIAQLILIEQNLVLQQDTLAQAQGEIATGLIQVFKALGGGWQIRSEGCEEPAVAANP